MPQPTPEAIEKLYKSVLNDVLAFAESRVDDAAAAEHVRQVFASRIPQQVPADLAQYVESQDPNLPAILRERAARELQEIATDEFGPDHPSRPFGGCVAQKATDYWLP